MSTTAIPETDILIEAACWQDEKDAEAIVRRAIAAAAATVEMPDGDTELAVLLTDDGGVQALNKTWRGIDAPTNVLSFPAVWRDDEVSETDGAPRMLGDIAIAYQTTRREAQDESKSFENHLAHLTIHGFLHLLGYDHTTDDEAEIMEGLERKILAQLGIPDPYAHHGQAD
ncbi:MAG: rRNA maturation RNase YbeY [Bradyrhizobiaceae bacterium]|nr:MAG: rRNA maturation RNase YbeY [Bradyrhizobiaceae bacterium]